MGHQFGLSDIPNERSSHNTVTPKGGGIGILAAFLFCALYTKISYWFWAPAAGVSVLGLFADRFEISPLARLVIQFVAAIIIATGIELVSVGSIKEIILIIFLTIYIVGTANYYNFMDGINGMAGITGVVGFGLLAVFAHSRGLDSDLKILSIALSLSCLGFLPFNIPNSKVFMGDVGSILLGFVFAAMIVWLSKSLLDFLCLASFVFPFYADEITTEVVRLKAGEKLWIPHRKHFYQLLANEYSIPHWKVSLGYGLWQLLVGVSILFFMNVGLLAIFAIIFLYFIIFTVISNVVRKNLDYKPSL